MYVSKATKQVAASPYVAEQSYASFDLTTQLKANILSRNYKHPTKIQAQAIPHINAGRDVLSVASTGSGKTAAFLIPMIDKVLRDSSQRCLIIVPTRELAGQIKREFLQFTKGTGLGAVLIIGGASVRLQIKSLKHKPEFIIGTPGRLIDLADRNILDLYQCNNIVLDEVDRMLDMGFIRDIKLLISQLGTAKQSLFFSATLSSEAHQIASSLLVDPIKIEIEKQAPLKNVDQDIVKVGSKKNKTDVLHELLLRDDFQKVLIFSRTKRGADTLTSVLRSRGFKVDSLHGDKSQFKRTKILASFKRNIFNILVATDVASRGIDVPDITHVINYDEPATYADYIHRIGRTGRIGKKGVALTFVRG